MIRQRFDKLIAAAPDVLPKAAYPQIPSYHKLSATASLSSNVQVNKQLVRFHALEMPVFVAGSKAEFLFHGMSRKFFRICMMIQNFIVFRLPILGEFPYPILR